MLRRRAAGELVNDADLDWPNIAEEIESVGNEQRHAVELLLINIVQHRLQIMAWPEAAVSHWQHEIDGWWVQVERRLRRAPNCGPTSRPSYPNFIWTPSGRCIARWTACHGRRCHPTARSHSPG